MWKLWTMRPNYPMRRKLAFPASAIRKRNTIAAPRSSTYMKWSDRFVFWFVPAMLLMISIPVALTFGTVKVSPYPPADQFCQFLAANPSPYGYTVSLLIFIFPIVLIAFWFLPKADIRIARRSFWWTIGLLFPTGGGLDFFFAQYFFTFPNRLATLDILAPAVGRPVPLEEYIFYFTGFVAVLLLYIWLDGYWLHAYSIPDGHFQRQKFERLLGFHPDSLIIACLLIAAGLIYRSRLNHQSTPPANGFPGYFLFLVTGALLPSIVLFPAVKRVINWRALGLTVFVLVLTSLLWEATLALPYGWWAFQQDQMLGIYILAWHNLPIEEVFVWIAVTYMTVMVFEAIRCWQASGKPAKKAFLGH